MLRWLVIAARLTLASSSASAQTVRLDQYQHPHAAVCREEAASWNRPNRRALVSRSERGLSLRQGM